MTLPLSSKLPLVPPAHVNWIQKHQCLVRSACAHAIVPISLYLCILLYFYISGTSGHVFTDVSQTQHNVTVTCTSIDDSSLIAQATVSGLQYLEVTVELVSTGTVIVVIIEENIGASHRCRLDNGPFVECKYWVI